jgi:hypothetical protein
MTEQAISPLRRRMIEDMTIRRPGDGCELGENLATQATLNLAERGSLGVREHQLAFSWSFRMRFSVARYSFRAQNCTGTPPAPLCRPCE